ncbi:MAG: hypothetical protein ACE145_05345 [Terriglobia bacterium]
MRGQDESMLRGILRGRFVSRWTTLLVMAVALLASPATASANVAVGISVSFGPPALPVYVQPPCPGMGYIWTPGYWAWDPDFGYFWVPGTWVLAPFPGALWTPGYWAYDDGFFWWHEGYWGPVVGYYGGIYYGFGYTGYGYYGGYWNGGRFYYNRAVNNVQTTNITTVYQKTVVNNTNVTRVSYSGGPGGVQAQPTTAQLAAVNQRRSGPVAEQTQQIRTAQSNPRLRASENKGRPEIAATPKPGQFSGGEVIRASRAGAPYRPPDLKAVRSNRSAPQAAPVESASPATRPAPKAAQPPRAEPRGRVERQAPEVERPAPSVERPAPAQEERPRMQRERVEPAPARPHPNAPRAPAERSQPEPRTERQPSLHAEQARPERQPRPQENRGHGNEHNPGKPHN